MEQIGNYALEKRLSAHQNREVFLARAPGGETVILKRLRLGQMSDWKAMQLFEREARTLQTLKHPRVPRLIDFFNEEEEGRTSLSMVMAYVKGPSLAERLKAGWRPPEAEVLEIARQGLEILIALHGHEVPIVHRDIKPSNLIWTESQELYLVDFGAVRDIFVSKGASTVIGTFGYMAPEQFAGQTVPASDLYGLGATLLHLLSGRSPSEIPQKHLMPDFRPYVACSLELQRWLEQMLVPDLEERFADAGKALDALKSLTRARESSPSGRLVWVRDGEDVRIELASGLNPRAIWRQYRSVLLMISAYLAAVAFIIYIFSFGLAGGSLLGSQTGYLAFMLIYGLIGSGVFAMAVRQIVLMAREQWLLRLLPDELRLESRNAAPTVLPRSAISDVRRSIAINRLTRDGICLQIAPGQGFAARNDQLELARGLGKWDHHWLMTKLLQYTHKPAAALPEAIGNAVILGAAPVTQPVQAPEPPASVSEAAQAEADAQPEAEPESPDVVKAGQPASEAPVAPEELEALEAEVV